MKKIALILNLLIILFIFFCTPSPEALSQVIATTKPAAVVHALGDGNASLISDITTAAISDAQNEIPPDWSEVHREFDNEGLTPKVVAKIYREAYLKQKKDQKVFLPIQGFTGSGNIIRFGGWLCAVIFFVALVFKKSFEDSVLDFLKVIREHIYVRLAGVRFLRRVALRKYRESLIRKYQRVRLPFTSEQPLDLRDVYVPLKVTGKIDSDVIEPSMVFVNHRCVVVVAPPGAGKSMLLRRLVLSYGDGTSTDLPFKTVPILLELHRFNGSSLTVEEHLISELQRNDFPSAGRFISDGLRRGGLFVLFDGLDEVNTNERSRIVKQIEDFLIRYVGCHAVITCRKAVYRDDFSNVSDRTVEIAEFADQQIRDFLILWFKSNPPIKNDSGIQKTVEHLLRELDEHPSIKILARNPLLLTIISYLYTRTSFQLPHSRAEFYKRSTDVLLEHWDELKHRDDQNTYSVSEKRVMLEALALAHQSLSEQNHEDSRSIGKDAVIRILMDTLPGVARTAEHAEPILKEIVDRSGLLLRLDNGERYQFTHFTLQEYFAAAKLLSETEKLVEFFVSNPDRWRETTKLWCGLSADSTFVIEEVFARDPLTAFECLSDARNVDAKTADKVLTWAKLSIEEAPEQDALGRAFGAAAASALPRGKDAFEYLVKGLTDNVIEKDGRLLATYAYSLSTTNLPQAATTLCRFRESGEAIRKALVRMGDLAVPAIGLLIESKPQDPSLYEDLAVIGTVQAASIMVPFLWHANPESKVIAAHTIVGLIQRPDIERSLGEYQIPDAYAKSERMDWVWSPFVAGESRNIRVIAGRVAHLINSSPLSLKSQICKGDPRIIIPLCTIGWPDTNRRMSRAAKANALELLRSDSMMDIRNARYAKLWSGIVEESAVRYQERINLLCMLDIFGARHAINIMSNPRQPDISDWKHLFLTADIDVRKIPMFWISLTATILLAMTGLVRLATQFTHALHINNIFIPVGFSAIAAGIYLYRSIYRVELDQKWTVDDDARLYHAFAKMSGLFVVVHICETLYLFVRDLDSQSTRSFVASVAVAIVFYWSILSVLSMSSWLVLGAILLTVTMFQVWLSIETGSKLKIKENVFQYLGKELLLTLNRRSSERANSSWRLRYWKIRY